METRNKLDEVLNDSLSSEHLSLEIPSVQSLAKARALVSSRAAAKQGTDIFLILARFLNMKIKLYHAALFFAIVAFAVYFSTHRQKTNEEPTAVDNKNYNVISSASSSTLMASIKTYGLKNKN